VWERRDVTQRSAGPWSRILSGYRTVKAVSRNAPLWTKVEFRVGKVLALIDTGAQFSCICSDIVAYLRRKGEPCEMSCAVTCKLADGSRTE
jgi:hypothetical protein